MDWWTVEHSMLNYVSYGHKWQPDVAVVMHAVNDLYRSFSPPELAILEYDSRYAHFFGASFNGASPPTLLGSVWRRP